MKGADGESRRVILELKVIADVGLLGKPNAGKSTLLSRLSRARPEIADYPFTTKYPNLGLVSANMERSFVMADIPGLIEGAADGAGLGHDFLRHIMRAGILVHLVEPLPSDQTDPIENYQTIRNELRTYSAELAARPEIVVVSKSEIPESAEVFDKLQALVQSPVLRISAVTGQGLNELIYRIVGLLDQQAKKLN
jgi:GTP-binding protein